MAVTRVDALVRDAAIRNEPAPARAPAADLGSQGHAGAGHTAGHHAALVWGLSIAVWTIASLAMGCSEYLYRLFAGEPQSYLEALWPQASEIFSYAPLSPFVFWLALRYPLQRGNWHRRSLLLLAGGIVFILLHAIVRSVTPYASWNPQIHAWQAVVTFSLTHGVRINWPDFERLVIYGCVQDLIYVYTGIVLIGHAVSYHQSFREGELRKSQLESQLATARLEALQSQLQPHFLFNTLHSISSLMLTDVAAADRMMSLLSDLLRMSLASKGSQVTTLRDELQFVDTYLEIESIRFEERLTVLRDISPDALDAIVPHLLLQPLVENAVKHGVARLSCGGQITITASRVGRDLHLQVSDNGPGLADRGQVPPGAGLGLKATQERLRTLYGTNQQMDIHAAGEGGVDVHLRIPLSLHDTDRALIA